MKYLIKADVLGRSNKDNKSRFRLKVSVHDIGIHIMGIIVQDSIIEGEKYYVTTPAHRVGAKFYKDVTFETSKELWLQIQDTCIKAVESSLTAEKPESTDSLEQLWK